MKTKLFLFDIEGTTTDFNFVHKVLFPYAKERMRDFVQKNQNKIQSSLNEVRETLIQEGANAESPDALTSALVKWIEEDRKHKALKDIQGLIWDQGYQNGDFKGHVYPDTKPFFEKIKSLGDRIAIYSSGSVHAQKLIMGHSTSGDLRPFIDEYFDTTMGHKREAQSYTNIAKTMNLPVDEIHFFSDIPEELKAAQEAGMKVTHIVREGTKASDFPGIKNFSEFKFD